MGALPNREPSKTIAGMKIHISLDQKVALAFITVAGSLLYALLH